MKRLPRCLCIALVICAVVTLLLRHESHHDLGTQALPGTRFKIQLIQVRTLGNVIGQGSGVVWCGLMDEQGAWQQTQRLYVTGKQKALSGVWNHTEALQVQEENGLQLVEIPLQFGDGSTEVKKVCLGLVPRM